MARRLQGPLDGPEYLLRRAGGDGSSDRAGALEARDAREGGECVCEGAACYCHRVAVQEALRESEGTW